MKTKLTHRIYLFFAFFSFLIGKAQLVNRALIVPEFGNNTVNTYFPTSPTTIGVNPNYTINFSILPNGLATSASPNCVAMLGNDLFVSLTKANQRIYRFPNYGTDPVNAIANVSQVTNQGNDYVGIAFDIAGNLYASEGIGGFPDTHIVKYTRASNYATRIDLGNGGIRSYFSNFAFDAAGNLWASDYYNQRILVIKLADLNTANALFRSYYTNSVRWATNGGMSSNLFQNLQSKTITKVFSQPEGIAFDKYGILWVANNNDSGVNQAPTVVAISTGLQATILNLPSNNPFLDADPNMSTSNNGFKIFNLPSLNPVVGGTGQLGGMQIDKTLGRMYVNDQNNGSGMWFDIANIANISDTYKNYKLNILSTNPGNGGIFLADSNQILKTETYSNTEKILNAFPNPSNGIFSISSTETIKNVVAYDVLGKEIEIKTLPNNQFLIEHKGVYFLKIELENGTIWNKKVIIE